MNNRAITLSVIMAVLAVFFVDSYVSSIEEKAKKEYGTEVLVVVAAKDIAEMTTIDETMLSTKAVPQKFIEPAAISFPAGKKTNEEAESKTRADLKSLVGSVAIVALKKDEQVTFSKLSEPGLRPGLSPQITPGKRGVTIPVDEVTGVGKLVKPGDRVDVIVTVDAGGRDSKFTKILYQDMPVLAVGRAVTNNVPRLVEREPGSAKTKIRSLASDDRFTSVTLEVEPAQAQVLNMILSLGRDTLSLALRNNDDTERVNLQGVSLYDALGPDAARVRQMMQERKGGGGGRGLAFPQ